jgi:hypothetical protein
MHGLDASGALAAPAEYRSIPTWRQPEQDQLSFCFFFFFFFFFFYKLKP